MIKLSKTMPEKYSGDLVAFLVSQPKKGSPKCAQTQVQKVIKRAHASGDFVGKEGQVIFHYPETTGKNRLHAKRLLVLGVGNEKIDQESFRKAGGAISAQAIKTKAKKIMVVVPENLDLATSDVAAGLSEGLILGAYQFKKYKAKNNDEVGELKEALLFAEDQVSARRGIKFGAIGARAACIARDMANEPGNQWTPSHFADFAKQLAKKNGLVCKVLSKAQMKQQGMGGILGVNQGSDQPPKMVILEYKVNPKASTLLLVGKGLTFDSGGISLKPSAGMEDMKYDMCGGAAVLSAMQAVSEAKLKKVNVIAIVPATENLPGPSALKPGDVISQYGGKTVEVKNTDAEGRLILADALAYGIKKFKPDMVVDMATLTGAVIIGLGHHRTGLLSNDDDLCERLISAGEESGEPVWRLPLGPEYTKQLKSTIADLSNIGNRAAGTITAGAFLQEFVGDTPWAHLDIAGTAWNFTEKSYVPKGPSGVGVRILFELIKNWRK